MRGEYDVVDRSRPLTELIAALSVCMLAAAFGAVIGPDWCRSWSIFGAFGLVSAVGLDVFRRTQNRFKEQKREKEMAIAAEQGLSKVVTTTQSSTAIRDALRKVRDNAVSAVSAASRSPTGCTRARLPSHKQVTITPLRGRSKTPEHRSGDSFAGYVRDISSYGVGLAHSHPLEPGPVLLAFDLRNGEQVSFVAEVLWCEPQGDGQYISGGKLMDVLNPGEAQSEMAGVAR